MPFVQLSDLRIKITVVRSLLSLSFGKLTTRRARCLTNRFKGVLRGVRMSHGRSARRDLASASPRPGDASPPETGDVLVRLSPSAFRSVQRIAALKGVDEAQAMSDALALQEAVAIEKSTGARLLIERHGSVEELAG
jgi:hypothetical protein